MKWTKKGKVTEIKYTGNLELFKLLLKILGRQDRRATAYSRLRNKRRGTLINF